MNIGTNLKKHRKAKGLTLSALAETSSVQIATLSRIENLKMTGTLESHMKIAKALGVEITELYKGIIREEINVDANQRGESTDVFIQNKNSSYEILTSRVLSKKMMPVLLKIEPGGQTNKEQNQAGAEKFMYTLEGKIEVHVNNNTYPLSVGHTLYFDASLEHVFINKGNTTAKVICVTTPVAL